MSPPHKLAGFEDELQFGVMRCLQQMPQFGQRALAKGPGHWDGMFSFCFQALVGVEKSLS